MALAIFRYLLVIFFLVAGFNHFRDPEFYLPMMPPYIPAHEFMVMFSGITEIVAAILLAIPKTSRIGAWFIIAHLLIFFTVHFYNAAGNKRKIREHSYLWTHASHCHPVYFDRLGVALYPLTGSRRSGGGRGRGARSHRTRRRCRLVVDRNHDLTKVTTVGDVFNGVARLSIGKHFVDDRIDPMAG